MTIAQFVRAATRLWYVVLVGAALTAFGIHQVRDASHAYWSKATVVLLPSRLESNGGNELLTKGPAALAAAAVAEVTRGPAVLRAATTDANLVGMGERSATLVQLRNGGGQWVPRAAGPYIDIEAVDASAADVTRRLDSAIAQVRAAVLRLEDQLRVPAQLKVSISQSPELVTVSVLGSSPSRAMAGTALAGIGATVAAVISLDRLLAARRRRRVRSDGPDEPGSVERTPDDDAVPSPD